MNYFNDRLVSPIIKNGYRCAYRRKINEGFLIYSDTYFICLPPNRRATIGQEGERIFYFHNKI